MAVPFLVPDAANPATSSTAPSSSVVTSSTTTSAGSVPQTPQPQNPSGGVTTQHSPLLTTVNSEYLVQAFCEALYRYSRVQGGWWRVFICWKKNWKHSKKVWHKNWHESLVIFKEENHEEKENFNLSFVKGVWTSFSVHSSHPEKFVDQKQRNKTHKKLICRVQKYLQDRDRAHLGRFWEFLDRQTHKTLLHDFDIFFTFDHAWLIFIYINISGYFLREKNLIKAWKEQKAVTPFIHLIFMLTFFTSVYELSALVSFISFIDLIALYQTHIKDYKFYKPLAKEKEISFVEWSSWNIH